MTRSQKKRTSSAQNEQQRNRRSDGKYDKGPECYCCGKSAGHNYQSHQLTDSVGTDGVEWHDTALVLCKRCAKATIDMTTVTQFNEYRELKLDAAKEDQHRG